MNKTALTLSVMLTALVISLIGGLVYSVKTGAQTVTATPATLTLSDQTRQEILDRDAAYQAVIEQAKAQITTLAQQNQILQAQIVAVTATPVPAATGVWVQTSYSGGGHSSSSSGNHESGGGGEHEGGDGGGGGGGDD